VTLQIAASLTIVIDDASLGSITIVSTFIVQASFTIVTYDRQNMFIIQATGAKAIKLFAAVNYRYFMAIMSLCVIKLYYLGNYRGMAVNYHANVSQHWPMIKQCKILWQFTNILKC
jgi:hypothetical protein